MEPTVDPSPAERSREPGPQAAPGGVGARRRGDLALVLSGGGARAAYQAGVLRGLARRLPQLEIPILTGISAGAINLGYLACARGSLDAKTEELVRVWSALEIDRVLEVGTLDLFARVTGWGLRLISGGHVSWKRRHGMIDVSPLRETLRDLLQAPDGVLRGIESNLKESPLSAVAVTTASYTTGRSITWIQGREIVDWERAHRTGVRCELSIDHVLASAALPLLFPAVRIGDDYYGDGGMRMTAPLSPAIHLGASRILAISTRYIPPYATVPGARRTLAQLPYPPPAQVAGVLLGSLFLDQFDADALRLERINRLLRECPHEAGEMLRPVELLILRPSQDLGRLAKEYEARLPKALRWLERGIGTSRDQASNVLLSMIMFQSDYAQRLVEVGEEDAERHMEAALALLED